MNKRIYTLYYPMLRGLIFGGGLFFLSIFLNTSFRVMGVDLSEFSELFVQEYGWIIVTGNFKILIVYLSFFGCLGYLVHIDSKNHKGSPVLEWIVFFYITIFAWILSIIIHPQIYSEFFYQSYPGLDWILYFLTDHIPPILPKIALWAGLLGMIGHILFKYFLVRDQEALFLLNGYIVFLFIHYHGNIFLLFLLLLCFPAFHFYFLRWKFKFIQYSPLVLLLFFVIFSSKPFLFFLWNTKILKNIQLISNKQFPEKPNIFLFSCDSLRLDRLGFVANNKNMTKNINLFAEDSVVYYDHHTTIPRTFPSWTDLLTGELSMVHGVTSMFPSEIDKKKIGSIKYPTIPQILNRRGYNSVAIGSFAGDIFPRANFGFKKLFTPKFNAKSITIHKSLESQIFLLPILTGSFLFGGAYMDEISGLPTFGNDAITKIRFRNFLLKNLTNYNFVVHFSSVAHFPYSPPYPHYKKYTNSNYYGKYKYLKYVDPSSSDQPNSEEIEQIRGLYDSSVHSYDEDFGYMIQLLKDLKLYDNSLIILTSDHGESLYESNHGQGHGEHLRGENVTKVPLIIKYPKNIQKNLLKKEIFEITSSLDIFPTIMDLLKIESGKKKKLGISLIPNQNFIKKSVNRKIYSESGIWFSDRGKQFFQKKRIPYPNIIELHSVNWNNDSDLEINHPYYNKKIFIAKYRSLQTNKWKFLYLPTPEGIEYELYNRIDDPNNQINLWQDKRYSAIGEELKKSLFELIKEQSNVQFLGEYMIPNN